MNRSFKYWVNEFLCTAGFHKWHYRKNGSATERVCLRSCCEKAERLQVRKDDKIVKFYQSKKSHTMRKIQEPK